MFQILPKGEKNLQFDIKVVGCIMFLRINFTILKIYSKDTNGFCFPFRYHLVNNGLGMYKVSFSLFIFIFCILFYLLKHYIPLFLKPYIYTIKVDLELDLAAAPTIQDHQAHYSPDFIKVTILREAAKEKVISFIFY